MTAGVKVPLFDELSDVPADPGAYGALGWTEGDSLFFVYDRYDIWGVDPTGTKNARCMTAGEGRKTRTRYRYVRLDPEERYVKAGAMMLLRAFDENNKSAGFARSEAAWEAAPRRLTMTPHMYPSVAKALNAGGVIFTRESFTEPTDLYLSDTSFSSPRRISDSNPQQKEFIWGTAEIVHWRGGTESPWRGSCTSRKGSTRQRSTR